MTTTTDNSQVLFPSRIGLGMAALGRPGYINLGHAGDLGREYQVSAMEAHAHNVLDAAWAAGIHYFDAARSYGRAEEFLQHWLQSRAIVPEAISVGSKWGYTYTADWQVEADVHEVKEHSLTRLTEQWQESRARLSPFLRLYQIHSATMESGVLENEPVLAALADLRANEEIAIGLSVSGPAQAETIFQALTVEFDGVRLFGAVQATWNLLEQAAGEALREAAAAGVEVIVKEALANGRLTARNTDPSFAEQQALLQNTAERLDTTIDALALATVLQQPWVSVVLSGAASTEHLHSNLAATTVILDEEAKKALARLVETPSAYWQTRSALPWN